MTPPLRVLSHERWTKVGEKMLCRGKFASESEYPCLQGEDSKLWHRASPSFPCKRESSFLPGLPLPRERRSGWNAKKVMEIACNSRCPRALLGIRFSPDSEQSCCRKALPISF